MTSSSYEYRIDLETLPESQTSVSTLTSQLNLVFRSERLASIRSFIDRFSLNGFRNGLGSIQVCLSSESGRAHGGQQ